VADAASTLAGAMRTPEEAAVILASGAVAVVAGTDALLAQLPTGNWIGGTMRYFMTPDGGLESGDRLLVMELPVPPDAATIRSYGPADLEHIPADAPDWGFSVVIIPSGSEAHVTYAERAPYFHGQFETPIVGWISGVSLADLGTVAPLVFDGRTGRPEDDRAVVLHVRLPRTKAARVGIVNLFRGGSGDVLTFAEEGLEARDCLVNGRPANLARYLAGIGADTRLPLVADYAGAAINTSFQAVDPDAGLVKFYAPVFHGIEYRLAAPVPDYAEAFAAAAAEVPPDAAFACNCILNYLYGELEGRPVGPVAGPMTFGEIAYQLLNQTLVRLSIEDIAG
jgi:hypothetical protein